HPGAASWTRLLLWASALGAAADLAVMALVGEVIPPLLVGALLTGVGIALVQRRPRAGIAMFGILALLLVITGAPFAGPSLAHPESPTSFVHGAIHLLSRLVAVAAAVGAWRDASPVTARRTGWVSGAVVGATLAVAAVATVAVDGDTAEDGDVVVAVEGAEFPETVRVATGGSLFVENDDLIHHSFTVDGTDISHQLPARTGVRFTVDLAPGTYEVICEVPGHDAMQADLVVG
ncbi:MAG TPA: hypothetical protein VFG94_06855, partial [Acidimicrobiales bacterium]|nr:hypothetical protein [Acidimicrobiales bacterium]